MMRHLIGAVLSLSVLAGEASAQTSPVVVELFTSQGCSACPPADELLGKLAKHDGVIALSLHVDYWDYIGWKDSFAQAQFTARQKKYARAHGQNSIYTPQIVVHGVYDVVGHDAMAVMEALDSVVATAPAVSLRVHREGEQLLVKLTPLRALKEPASVYMVRFTPLRHVDIRAGENAGRMMDYVNVVSEWQNLGDWAGHEPVEFSTEVKGDDDVAVLVQSTGQGEILAAARPVD